MQEQIEKLKAPFPPSQIKTRKVAGKAIYYISIDSVIERLNNVLGMDWSTSITQSNLKEIDGPKKSFQAECVVRLSALGTSREGVGAHVANNPDDALKGSLAEATKKAAVYFGIGSELWCVARRIWCDKLYNYKEHTPAYVKKQLDAAINSWLSEDNSLRSFQDKKSMRSVFLKEACLTEEEIKEFRSFLMTQNSPSKEKTEK